MQHQLRNYLLFHIFTVAFVISSQAQNFTQESLNTLKEVVHQFESSTMPAPTPSASIPPNAPCMPEVNRRLQLHYDNMKNEPRTAVYASGKGKDNNPGFLEMMTKVDEKIASLSNQIQNFSGSLSAPGVFVYSAFEGSSNYGEFVSNFTGKDVGEFPEPVRNELRELYETLAPLKKEKGTPGSFNYMTIFYGSDNIEGCRGTESGRLYFKSMDYPQIIWEVQHTFILNCPCTSTSADEVKRINVEITADVYSNISGGSMNNLQFQRSGQPSVKLTDVACCGSFTAPSQPLASSNDNRPTNTSRRNQTSVNPTYFGDTSNLEGGMYGSGIEYENTLGGKVGFGYQKGGRYSICAGAQFLAPIGDPICKNGSGQLIGGVEASYDYVNSGDDFATQTEQWIGIAPRIMITKRLGTNVDLLTGIRVPLRIGNSKYQFEDSTSPTEESTTDLRSYGADLFSGFSFVICYGIYMQAIFNVFEYTNTTFIPDGNSDFKSEETDWRFMFNKRNPLEVSLNFPL